MGRLTGRKAVVTGASRGIGRAVALRFAHEGADMVLTSRHPADLDDTVAAAAAAGVRALPMAWDVRDIGAVDERLAAARAGLGGLDILVNNAGVVRLPADHPASGPEAAWDYIMDINLKGLYFLSQRAAELMKEHGGGAIVNLASDAGMRGAPSPYGISKWGVIGFTKGLARQMAADGVRVNAVAPGPVATRMMGCEDGQPRASQGLPLGRFALPEEVADVVLFLASDDARGVFGHTIVVNTANT